MAAVQGLAVIVPAGGGTFRHRAGLGSAAGGPSVRRFLSGKWINDVTVFARADAGV